MVMVQNALEGSKIYTYCTYPKHIVLSELTFKQSYSAEEHPFKKLFQKKPVLSVHSLVYLILMALQM